MLPNARRAVLASALSLGSSAVAASQDEPSVPLAPKVLWCYPGTRTEVRPPVYHRGLVYVGGQRLVALSPATGRPLHQAREEGPWGQPLLHGDIVLAHRYDGGVYAFVFSLDRLLWHTHEAQPSRLGGAVCGEIYVVPAGNGLVGLALDDGSELRRREVGDAITVSLATDGQRVYFGTDSGWVVAVHGADGTQAWRAETGSKFVFSDPLVHGGVLLIADRGRGDRFNPADRGKQPGEVDGGRAGALHAFDTATGRHLWGRIFGATGCSRPHVHDGYVWAGFGRSVARFDLDHDGALDLDGAIATGANAFGSPTVIGRHIVFGNLDGHLYVHDRESRALVWAFAPGVDSDRAGGVHRAQVGAFVFGGSRLFVTTSNGLYALGDDPDAEPVAPGFVLRPEADGRRR